jgi:hypothetical protein
MPAKSDFRQVRLVASDDPVSRELPSNPFDQSIFTFEAAYLFSGRSDDLEK